MSAKSAERAIQIACGEVLRAKPTLANRIALESRAAGSRWKRYGKDRVAGAPLRRFCHRRYGRGATPRHWLRAPYAVLRLEGRLLSATGNLAKRGAMALSLRKRRVVVPRARSAMALLVARPMGRVPAAGPQQHATQSASAYASRRSFATVCLPRPLGLELPTRRSTHRRLSRLRRLLARHPI